MAARIDSDAASVAAVLHEVATRFHDVALVATREAERRAELAEQAPALVTAPILDHDINDVADLLELGELLRR